MPKTRGGCRRLPPAQAGSHAAGPGHCRPPSVSFPRSASFPRRRESMVVVAVTVALIRVIPAQAGIQGCGRKPTHRGGPAARPDGSCKARRRPNPASPTQVPQAACHAPGVLSQCPGRAARHSRAGGNPGMRPETDTSRRPRRTAGRLLQGTPPSQVRRCAWTIRHRETTPARRGSCQAAVPGAHGPVTPHASEIPATACAVRRRRARHRHKAGRHAERASCNVLTCNVCCGVVRSGLQPLSATPKRRT